jgi:hypothetical protein
MVPLFYDQQSGSTLYFTQCRSIGLGSTVSADPTISMVSADLTVPPGPDLGCFKTHVSHNTEENWATKLGDVVSLGPEGMRASNVS